MDKYFCAVPVSIMLIFVIFILIPNRGNIIKTVESDNHTNDIRENMIKKSDSKFIKRFYEGSGKSGFESYDDSLIK